MRLAACAFVLALTGVLAFDSFAATTTTGRAKITAVKFTGSPANPVVTVHGVNLGARPLPNPSYQPLGHPPLGPPNATRASSSYGFDYGTNLYLADSTQHPVWSAGRYRPSLNELDCIGVIVIKFTRTLVVFRLDAF